MASVIKAPQHRSGPHDGDRNTLLLVVAGLVVLLLAIAVVAATTLTGADPAVSAEQARAAKLDKLAPYWKVHTGDSYEEIAAKTGLTVDQLEQFNPYVDPAAIIPGQRIKLRLHEPKPKPKPPGPRFHTLRAGESFGSVAAKTGHSIARLQQLNPKLKARALQPGQRLRLRR